MISLTQVCQTVRQLIATPWDDKKPSSNPSANTNNKANNANNESKTNTSKICDLVFNCMLLALEDYSADKRGDVGSWYFDLVC